MFQNCADQIRQSVWVQYLLAKEWGVTFAHTTFAQRHLPRDFCQCNVCSEGHLPRRHLLRKTFAHKDSCLTFMGKCLLGKMSSGQMSFWANVHPGKRPSGPFSSGKMTSGQISFWAHVSWLSSYGKKNPNT
jgi:hypothetical protein